MMSPSPEKDNDDSFMTDSFMIDTEGASDSENNLNWTRMERKAATVTD